MSDKKKDKPAPMPKTIMVGDMIKLAEGKREPYQRQYGEHMGDMKWQVQRTDKVSGRTSLWVPETPGMIWLNNAKLAYMPQSKERREHLTKLGVSLP